ncbi:MAG: hypothetical protein HC869_10730 [Rhodospirillales bacterium]|nr:hypothetical protein [Rhodospirillales bacterium]
MMLLRALASKSRELELTLNHMTQGILMVAPDRKVPVINQRAIELLDLPRSLASQPATFDDILNFQQKCQEFGKDGVSVEPVVWDSIKQGGGSTHVPLYERVRPNGTALEIRTVPLPDGGLVRTFTDITERRRAEGEVRAMALRDELTGLANGPGFRSIFRTHFTGCSAPGKVSASSASTSIVSKPSMIRSVTPPGICFCSRWLSVCSSAWRRRTLWRA